MTIGWIFIIIFIVLMVAMAFMYRNATLKKLPLFPGEYTLFEEKKVRVGQKGTGQDTIFINCIVRVTNYRIIIAQKVLLGNTYALRHVITYNEYSEKTDLKKTLTRGFIIFTINHSNVKIIRDTKGTKIQIDIPESMLTKGQYVEFKTEMGEKYSGIFA